MNFSTGGGAGESGSTHQVYRATSCGDFRKWALVTNNLLELGAECQPYPAPAWLNGNVIRPNNRERSGLGSVQSLYDRVFGSF